MLGVSANDAKALKAVLRVDDKDGFFAYKEGIRSLLEYEPSSPPPQPSALQRNGRRF